MFVGIVIVIVALVHFNVKSMEMKNPACEEFSNGSSFEPTEVMDSDWRVFYYWDQYSELLPIKVSLPTQEDIYIYKKALNASGLSNIFDWTKAKLVMIPAPTRSLLFFEKDKPTAYDVILLNRPDYWNPRQIEFSEIRIKTVGRYMGIMVCINQTTVYALARSKEVPANQDLEKAAATVFKGEGIKGHSYLYKPPNDVY